MYYRPTEKCTAHGHGPFFATLQYYNYYGSFIAIIMQLLILIEHNNIIIITKHSTYSAIMYFTGIVGARFGMHAHSVVVSQ